MNLSKNFSMNVWMNQKVYLRTQLVIKYSNFVVDILNTIFKRKMENFVPNAVIAYRILLTTPVSVTTGERSFSKLKIIKNYLRNTIHQERLNSLAIISIEHDIAKSFEYNDIIDDLASAKAMARITKWLLYELEDLLIVNAI